MNEERFFPETAFHGYLLAAGRRGLLLLFMLLLHSTRYICIRLDSDL